MPTAGATDFDIDAFYGALDAERRSRGLSWQQLAHEINERLPRPRVRPISPTTLSGMRSHRAIEGDSALQALRWLNCAPESFVAGSAGTIREARVLPDVGPGRILRFDTRRMYTMLEARRSEREITWTQVAREIGGVTAAGLTRYAKGGRTGFPHVVRIARWLECPVASLTGGFDW